MPRLLLSAIFALWAARAAAAPITLVYQGSGAGSLGGVAFAATGFTITAHADTASRYVFEEALVLDHVSAQAAIDGVGVYQFVSGTRTFLSPGAALVGFGREYTGEFTSGDLIYAPFNSALGSWDMTTSLGPISGPGEVFQWSNNPPVVTDGGALVFADGTPAITFQAIVVPEPAASWAALGALVVAGVVRGAGPKADSANPPGSTGCWTHR